jgi:hypothetical protein
MCDSESGFKDRPALPAFDEDRDYDRIPNFKAVSAALTRWELEGGSGLLFWNLMEAWGVPPCQCQVTCKTM